MRKELEIKTRSLAGSSDLTLLAPLKVGLVPSLEAVTYKTRVQRLLRTLNVARSSSHEYSLLRPFSDAVERVGKIQSVRVAIVEPEDKVLLAVTFDGAWESYIRVLWQKVGSLLDVIFCNTQDYVSAFDHTFEEWTQWANRVQIETAFFYGTPAHTVDDVRYLRRQEAIHRMDEGTRRQLFQIADRDRIATQVATQSVETAASLQQATPLTGLEAVRQGLQGLAVLYRLTDVFVPGSPDGKYMRRAARELLREFLELTGDSGSESELLEQRMRVRFERQLTWLRDTGGDKERQAPQPALPTFSQTDVQGGILTSYAHVTHGCMMFMAFDTTAAAASFLETLARQITSEGEAPSPSRPSINAAFTYEGLRLVGLTEHQLGWFPQEFREGMEARASVLGDFRINHPRRWRLPVATGAAVDDPDPPRIELSSVHLIVQLRAVADQDLSIDDPLDPDHPLNGKLTELLSGHSGAHLLAIQSLRRYTKDKQIREHFGFADGSSDPVIDPAAAGTNFPNYVQLGEVLLGYANEADGPPDTSTPQASERMALLRNGSFLVVRKLRQDVAALYERAGEAAQNAKTEAEEEAARAAIIETATSGKAAAPKEYKISREDVLAKMMGRTLDGDPLAGPGSVNDFNYQQDSEGVACPFHSHIRRANPRAPVGVGEPPGQRTPRLIRRGMAYGPRYRLDPQSEDEKKLNQAERGLVFMAYNASISEQFELVQRWLTGGNSSGGYSGESDPFLGVAEIDQPRWFRFEHNQRVVRMALDGSTDLLAEPQPLVRLEWGMYLFTPSLTALRKLIGIAQTQSTLPAPVWSVDEGIRRIAVLQRIEREHGGERAAEMWKSTVEDPGARDKFMSASLWAAIRANHGGVLKTPYGVLVADRKLLMKVFGDASGRYTVRGYHDRLSRSLGAIYLGLDRPADGSGDYDIQSAGTNAAISTVDEPTAFSRARALTRQTLDDFIADERTHSKTKRWELNLDVAEVIDKVLAALCHHWFGVPTKDGPIVPGGARWDWRTEQAPLCPGNFTAPSRFVFQPRPGDTVEEYGTVYGYHLTRAMREFVDQFYKQSAAARAQAPLTAAIALDHERNSLGQDQLARTLVGVLMGFLPTVDGNLRLSLNQWLRDGTFWSLRATLLERRTARASADATEADAYSDANEFVRAPLMSAMQLRPSPELAWRTATERHTLGSVTVEPGDVIVLAIVSATQQCLQEGTRDVFPIFGGDRRKQPHPTHACPGYQLAMGVMLGVLSALLEVKESMRPSPAPLSFTFEGPRANAAPSPQETDPND